MTSSAKDLTGKKIAVIGGGFTGLVSAYRLSERGADVTIYEFHNDLGGLVRGYTLKNGTNIERAYHFLYKTDEYIIGLAEELGLREKLHFHQSSIAAFYGGKIYNLVTPKDLLTFTPIPFIDRVRTGFVGLYLQNVRNWEKLTNVTAYEWLSKYNGKRATKVIWEPLLRGKFHKYYDQVTMAWLWTRIKVRQDSKEKGELTEKLGYFDGSFDIVVTELEKRLKANKATFKMGTGIDSIAYKNDKPVLTDSKGKTTTYDGIVSTVPSPVFGDMLAKEPKAEKAYIEKLKSIDYLAAVTMIITTKQEISDYYWHQIHDEDAPFLVMLSLTALTQDTSPYDGNHVYYIGDYVPHDDELFKMSEKEIIARWYKGVHKLFPHFDESQVQEVKAFKFGNAQHIVNVGFEQKRPDYKTPLPHTYLANFSQIYPQDRGTNYAVRDGNDIAKMLADDLLES